MKPDWLSDTTMLNVRENYDRLSLAKANLFHAIQAADAMEHYIGRTALHLDTKMDLSDTTIRLVGRLILKDVLKKFPDTGDRAIAVAAD